MVSFFNGVISWLVVEPTHLKNMLVKMGSSSLNRGENKKYLSCHHLGILLLWRVIKNLLVQQWISYGPSLPVKYVKALHRLNHTANHGNQDCRPYSEACPQKNRPYIDFINQSKPWHQPVTQPKQATNHESIHPKPQQKKSTTWLLSHPDPSRHDLKISFFTQQPPLRHDVQLLNYIDGLASAWTSAVVFQRVPAVYWDPQVGSNSFQLEIDGCPDCSVFFSKTHIGFCQAIQGTN